MNRLDIITEAIFAHGTLSKPIHKTNGWSGSYVVFHEGPDHHMYFGKTTVEFKSKSPQKATIRREVKAEIKKRLLDKGWYRSGLRRLLGSVQYTEISTMDDFSKQKVTLSGYKHRECPGLCSNYTMALVSYLSMYADPLWDEVTEIGKPYGGKIKSNK